MKNLALALIKERITKPRVGVNEPAYMHSIRVYEALRSLGYHESVCVAGLLHDVVEDSSVTFKELKSMGFTNRVVDLVALCTHDVRILDTDARWLAMLSNIATIGDREAFAIKACDLIDNLGQSEHLRPERTYTMHHFKLPVIRGLARRLANDALFAYIEDFVDNS